MSPINKIRRNKLDQYIPLSDYEKRSITTSYFQYERFSYCPAIIPKSGYANPLFARRCKFKSLLQKRISLRTEDY
jgi:hypothetical protein